MTKGHITVRVRPYPDEDGVCIAGCPALQGCVSQGATRAEALDNIRDAIELVILTRAELGRPVTLKELCATAEHEVLIDATAVAGYREGV